MMISKSEQNRIKPYLYTLYSRIAEAILIITSAIIGEPIFNYPTYESKELIKIAIEKLDDSYEEGITYFSDNLIRSFSVMDQILSEYISIYDVIESTSELGIGPSEEDVLNELKKMATLIERPDLIRNIDKALDFLERDEL